MQVTAHALSDLGVPWVILGHSERRKNNLESSEVVGRKTKKALSNGLKVIACIGETLDERDSGKVRKFCGSFRSCSAGQQGRKERVGICQKLFVVF